MGCSSCGTGSNGAPSGCKSNGSCNSGGCNRLNVFDWLANLPFHDPESSCKIIEVAFNNGSRKDFFRNTTLQTFIKGELVTVEGVSGFDLGEVSATGEMVRLQMKKKNVDEASDEIKKILRRAGEMDIQKWQENKNREPQALIRARAIARQLKLQMKLCEVEFQADGRKATFFYTADDRVDFRELIKMYAGDFKVKVEMKQIGARQESSKVGGIGSCGRELCCSSWLSDFKSVTTTVARYQNLSINQAKLSGQCGRLKCCLNFELDTYLDALQHFPDNADMLETQKGNAILIKKDIFKNVMWYIIPGSNQHYPVAIDTVKKIKAANQKGIKVEELETIDIKTGEKPIEEPQFVDVVGQISLRTLERNSQKRKQKDRDQRDSRENPNNRSQKDSRENRNPNTPRPSVVKPNSNAEAAKPSINPNVAKPTSNPDVAKPKPIIGIVKPKNNPNNPENSNNPENNLPNNPEKTPNNNNPNRRRR